MAKKLGYYDRKRLFEAMQGGLSNTKLKDKFGIADNRTLSRHLRLAEQEEEARVVKMEILKDALVDHLAEVRTLIEKWKGSLSTPGVDSMYFDMPLTPTQNIEANPLFGSLKGHLPFPTLWRNYASWKTKVRSYTEGCQKVMREIGETEERTVTEDVFKLWGAESTTKAIALSEPLHRMREKYREAAKADSHLKTLLEQLKPIEIKLHESLQDIQLRHDHIVYACKLCPGQARLLR